MTEERCTCCELPIYSCGRTQERLQARQALLERQAALRKPGATLAAFPGQCGDCGERYEKGTPIQARTAMGHRRPVERGERPSWRSLLCCGGES